MRQAVFLNNKNLRGIKPAFFGGANFIALNPLAQKANQCRVFWRRRRNSHN